MIFRSSILFKHVDKVDPLEVLPVLPGLSPSVTALDLDKGWIREAKLDGITLIQSIIIIQDDLPTTYLNINPSVVAFDDFLPFAFDSFPTVLFDSLPSMVSRWFSLMPFYDSDEEELPQAVFWEYYSLTDHLSCRDYLKEVIFKTALIDCESKDLRIHRLEANRSSDLNLVKASIHCVFPPLRSVLLNRS